MPRSVRKNTLGLSTSHHYQIHCRLAAQKQRWLSGSAPSSRMPSFLDELKEQFREQAGKRVIVTHNEYIHALRYREAVLNHPEAAVLLDEGEAEASIYWHHAETGELLKCRPDWMRPDHVLADLKFVRNASEAGFARDASAHNYHIQDAHYCDGYRAVTGHPASFVFIAVEKDGPLGQDVYKPIMVGVYYFGSEDQHRALELRDLAVRNIVTWRRQNYYPGHEALQWGMNPFPVAQKTHLVKGVLGYEAQLVNAVVVNSGAIKGRFEYEFFGPWEKVVGKFREVTDKDRGTTYRIPNWSFADEKGCGVYVRAELANGDFREIELLLSKPEHVIQPSGQMIQSSSLLT
ncbi:UNVERIFIED_CONTAM: hypothetical protein K2H54_000295 [Gekko kuhli]